MSWKAWKADCEPRLLPGSQAIDMALGLQLVNERFQHVLLGAVPCHYSKSMPGLLQSMDETLHHCTRNNTNISVPINLSGCPSSWMDATDTCSCWVAGMAWCWKWCGETSRRHHFSCPGITKQSWWMKGWMFLARFASMWWGSSARKLERLEWSTTQPKLPQNGLKGTGSREYSVLRFGKPLEDWQFQLPRDWVVAQQLGLLGPLVAKTGQHWQPPRHSFYLVMEFLILHIEKNERYMMVIDVYSLEIHVETCMFPRYCFGDALKNIFRYHGVGACFKSLQKVWWSILFQLVLHWWFGARWFRFLVSPYERDWIP